MKNISKILAATAVVASAFLAAPAAHAQFDFWGQPRTVVAVAPTTLNFNSGASPLTNGYIDLHVFTGIGKLDLIGWTNQAGGTLTATLIHSDDTTNWYTVSNYSACVYTTFKYTNNLYGTQTPVGTNNFLLPGTWTTPTVATAGFASPYVAASPFTNSGAITFVASGNLGAMSVGINCEDLRRYLAVVWTTGGTVTNCVIGADLTARSSYPYP